jgi:hypothetical protein
MDDPAGKEKQLRQGDIAARMVDPIPGRRVHVPATNCVLDAQRKCDSSKQLGVLLRGFSYNRHAVQLPGNLL